MVVDEAYWAAVRTIRLELADLLDSLTAAEWDTQSVCPAWRVRDVAGHVASVPTITTWQMLSVTPRAGFNPHRVNAVLGRLEGSAEPSAIIRSLREHAGARRTAKVLDVRNGLFDIVVHSQDIAIPLGRDFPVDAEHAALGLTRVWEMGWPFRARRRFAGHTLRATDADWEVGSGPVVSGTALSLLLLLTGRPSTVSGRR